jgi:hypothetical protein
VGKDLVARFIHTRSGRAARPFVAINCAGVTETLLESELFGHVRGSFTGAHRDKVGLFQVGHRGTVFLDEVGEMSLRMQALLLRFLENGEVKPVGSDAVSAKVDVRVISATNRSLPDLVARGLFREDLMYRINVVHLQVPPLRERGSDVRQLIAHLVEKSGASLSISEEAIQALERYRWPGNVRELQNGGAVNWCTRRVGGGGTFRPGERGERSDDTGRDRRKRVADHLYEALVSRSCSFWEHVYPMFINRDLTRADLTMLVRQGLAETSGNYRALLQLFGMVPSDYKRFLNLLSTHGCTVNFREFRSGQSTIERPIEPILKLPTSKADRSSGGESAQPEAKSA